MQTIGRLSLEADLSASIFAITLSPPQKKTSAIAATDALIKVTIERAFRGFMVNLQFLGLANTMFAGIG